MNFLNFIRENKSSFWEDCRILVLNQIAASLPQNYPAFDENCLGLYSRITIIQIIEVPLRLNDWLGEADVKINNAKLIIKSKIK